MNALCRLDVNLGVALAHAEHHGVFAARLIHELFAHVLAETDKDNQRQNKGQQETENWGSGLLDFLLELCAGIVQTLYQLRVIHFTGLVCGLVGFVGKNNFAVVNFDFSDVFVSNHAQKRAVIDILDLMLHEHRPCDQVQQNHDQQNDSVIKDQRLFGVFDFFHGIISSCLFVRDVFCSGFASCYAGAPCPV